MSMCNLIEYSNTYWKTSGSLWQYDRNEPALNNSNNIIDFPTYNINSTLFKFKQKITGQTENDDTKDAEIMVPLKNLSIFWRVLEMPLTNCEIKIQLKWFTKCF